MDVCSGAIHVVDDVTYDVIALYEEKNLEEIKKELSDTYNKEEIEEVIDILKVQYGFDYKIKGNEVQLFATNK